MPSFKGHLQQDVQEFFCQLLSKLNNEKTHPDPNCSEEILNCVVNRMFTGAWQSEVTCIGCGNSNQNKEQFNTLPLEFPNKYHKIQVRVDSPAGKVPGTIKFCRSSNSHILDGVKINNTRSFTSILHSI